MNRNTGIVLGILLVLIGAVLWLENQPEEQAVERWTLPGFIENGALAVKTTTDLVEGKIDRIRIEREGSAFTLEREEGEWRMTNPRRAVVESMQVKSMLLPLQKETISLFSQTLVEKDRALYGFDDGITVELFAGDTLFATFIAGDKIKSDDPDADTDEVDTWVMKPESNRIFRMGSNDLRTPFDHTMSSVRSKRLVPFAKEDLRTISLKNPESADTPVLKLRDTAQEGEERTPEWIIEEPAGYQVGNTSGIVNAFIGMRVKDYSPKGITLESAGLRPEDNPFTVQLGFASGETLEARIGKTVGKEVYGTVVGTEEIFSLEDYVANGLKKGLNDVRNRKVLGLTAGAITEIRIASTGVRLLRTPDGWTLPSHPTIPVSDAEVERFLSDVEGWSVSGFAPLAEENGKGLSPSDSPEEITFAHNGTRSTLRLGKAVGEVHWARRTGETGELWKVTNFMAKKFLDKGPNAFRNKSVFTFKRDDVQRVELVHSNQTLVIERTGEGTKESPWRVIRGEDILEQPKPQLVSSVLSSLANVQVKAFADDITPEKAGLERAETFEARIELADGRKHRLRISDDSREKSPYATTPTVGIWKGKTFTINRFQSENIRVKYKEFVN